MDLLLDQPTVTIPDALLTRLRDRVFERKPFLKNIIEKLGDKSLLIYVRGYRDIEMHADVKARQAEFLGTFEEEVKETLSADIARRARRQLEKTFFVSTNDHHGPLNAFDAFNAHLLLAVESMTGPPEDAMDAIIVFSCCNVSLNNCSFPRGLLFSVNTSEALTMRRLSLLPSNAHASSLYGYRSYQPREIEKLRKLVRQYGRENTVPKHIAVKLDRIVTDVFADAEILRRKTYSAQASIINSKLWNLVFEGQPHPPALVSIGQERLVSRLLQAHHLGKGTIINQFIFAPEFERLILKHFDGIYGAFSKNDNQGTYLFWGRDTADGMRLKMHRSGDSLVSEDGTFSVAWTPEAIADALKQRTLIPSLLLVFSVLSFYYGLKCLGGYSQVNYLTFMKDAFMAMMRELGETAVADACLPVSTKNWSGFTFAYIQNALQTIAPAQFIDLYLYSDIAMWDRIRHYAGELKLREAVEPLLPEIYRYSYGETERDAALLGISTEQIVAAAKLKPCITIS